MSDSLSPHNQAISQRLNHLLQAPIPLWQLQQVLVEITSKNIRFMTWLKENGYSDILTKNPNLKQSAYSKEDNTRFPWFSKDGKLMITREAVAELELAMGVNPSINGNHVAIQNGFSREKQL